MELILSADEAYVLRDILADELSDLRVEIRRTDTHAVREGLRTREHLLERILAELGGPPEAQGDVA